MQSVVDLGACAPGPEGDADQVPAAGDHRHPQGREVLEGKELEVREHQLEAADLRILYSLASDKSDELSERYKADIVVLLDTTPDQEMLATVG